MERLYQLKSLWKEYFNDDRILVSIFMSPFNIHVTRYPISGKFYTVNTILANTLLHGILNLRKSKEQLLWLKIKSWSNFISTTAGTLLEE